MNIEEIVQYYPTCKVTNFKKGKNTMKKSISIILAVLMLVSCIPMFASAATITLDRKNVVIIPPTVSPTEVPWGAGCVADVTVTGGKLWYVDADGNRTEVAGHFDIRNKATLNPSSTGEYKPPLVFYPDDTETYGTSTSGSLSHLTMKNSIVSGEWPVIYLRGKYTEVTTPPAFTCDAGDNLSTYTNYTKTGGKVVDENGKDVTSYGQFYIDEANSGGKNQYLYEDTYVTARWDDIKRGGHESAYYENVLVKVTRKTATLATAPSIPAVFVGTTYGEALALLTATVTLVGNKTKNDTTNKFWVPVYPEGITAETPINEDTTITVKYENPATDDTFTAEVAIDTYTKPLAVISEVPEIDLTNIKPGMKASSLTLTGGKAVKEGTDTAVSGTFSLVEPDKTLIAGSNLIEVIFTPDDTAAYDGTSTDFRINVASLFTTVPTIDATGVLAGAKAGELSLIGGEATEEGTFSIADPEQILKVGSNAIDIKFTPTAQDAEYYDTARVYQWIKGEFFFLDKDGNETVPVYTVPYGVRLSDSNTNIQTILAQTGCSLNCTERFSYRSPDNDNYIFGSASYGITPDVGTHIMEVLVVSHAANIYSEPAYENKVLQFIIEVEPVEMNVMSVSHSGSANELTVRVDSLGAKGTYDIYIDGEQIADNATAMKYGTDTWLTVKAEWMPKITVNKDYTVKVVYNPIENDPVSMEDYEGTFRTNLPFTVYKDGMFTMYAGKSETSGDSYDKAYEGKTRIQCVVPYAQQADFVTWYITDEDGNELDIEVYGIKKSAGVGGATVETKVEAELTDTTIYFDMPNCNVRVSYKTQSMIDEEAKQEAIDNCNCLCHYTNPVAEFIWKIISFFMNLFGIDKPCACGFAHEVK